MENPNGYTGDSLLTCKVRNPLYGLNQAPRECHPKLNSSILSYRFKDASLGTKVTTFILLSSIRLEEGGEVHMHCTRESVHIKTI